MSLSAARVWILIGLALLVILAKGIILFLVGRAFNLRGRDHWLFTLGLAQAGEFGFVLSLASGVEKADVVAALVNNGIRVKSIAEKGFDLETHFRQQLETGVQNAKDWTQHEGDSSR